jgi:hypothetical protein
MDLIMDRITTGIVAMDIITAGKPAEGVMRVGYGQTVASGFH